MKIYPLCRNFSTKEKQNVNNKISTKAQTQEQEPAHKL